MARRIRRPAAPAAGPRGIHALDDMLDLAAAAPLRTALVVHRGLDLSVDASAVQHLGALCAQVLASAAATWAADGRSFDVQAPSEAFIRGARFLGLEAILTTESVPA